MAIIDRKEDYLHIRWAQEVKRRDGFACVICGKHGNLNAHHKNAYASYPDQRYDVDNGVTLCADTFVEGVREPSACHNLFHKIYGKGDNTEEQFDDFEKHMSLLQKLAEKKAKSLKIAALIKEQLKEDGYVA
jgi:predicted secreted Zn-dependent protease